MHFQPILRDMFEQKRSIRTVSFYVVIRSYCGAVRYLVRGEMLWRNKHTLGGWRHLELVLSVPKYLHT
jgi:hypothetical protein